jgi:hypothetical protein
VLVVGIMFRVLIEDKAPLRKQKEGLAVNTRLLYYPRQEYCATGFRIVLFLQFNGSPSTIVLLCKIQFFIAK